MSFSQFAKQLAHHVDTMAKTDLWTTNLTGAEVYDLYQQAFPTGTNEIYKERPAHDCNSCRAFIKQVGNLVNIKDGKITTIWDVAALPYPYDVVAAELSAHIRAAANPLNPLNHLKLFKTTSHAAGTQHNFQQLEDGSIKKWEHLHCTYLGCSVSTDPGPDTASATANVAVIYRGLVEISIEAVNTVLELVAQNNLYRGVQHKKALTDFLAAQIKFKALDATAQHLFACEHHNNSALRIRNTSLGTLLTALSEGTDLETAVVAYERMVAPENYRRPSSLITKSMVQKALEKVDQLGLTEALERRSATASDIPLQHTLWVHRPEQPKLTSSLTDTLLEGTTKKQAVSTDFQEISINKFITSVLPTATKLELLFEPQNSNRLVSLTTAAQEDTPSLFSWPHPVAWSYKGNVTDSIKLRVKQAGGNVNAFGRVSLSWHNKDDLDLHVIDAAGVEIFFGNKYSPNSSGRLDVDMNVNAANAIIGAVENICWSRMPAGAYDVFVHNYCKRDHTNTGFEIEIEIAGVTKSLFCNQSPTHNGSTQVCIINVADPESYSIQLHPHITTTPLNGSEWGLNFNEYHPVRLLTVSPNYWGHQTGNKHWLFMVEGCVNPDPIRGIYNEYLRSDLQPHRKVFEILGAKTAVSPSLQQLSGFGFSETISASCVIKADGRPYRVLFASPTGEQHV